MGGSDHDSIGSEPEDSPSEMSKYVQFMRFCAWSHMSYRQMFSLQLLGIGVILHHEYHYIITLLFDNKLCLSVIVPATESTWLFPEEK